MDIINSIFTEDFIMFIAALSLLMLGNASSGAMKARKEGTFSWKELGNGILTYAMWAFSAGLTVAGIQLYGGELQVTIDEITVTLLEALEIAKKTVYIYWAAKAVQNFIQYGNTEKKVEPVDVVGGDDSLVG